MVPSLGREGRFTPLRARLSASSIDAKLAAGVPAWESPVYAARARQLTSATMRRKLADALDGVVTANAKRSERMLMTAAVLPQQAAVEESRPQLLLLAARLRAGSPVSARGMASIRTLLTSGTSPLYIQCEQRTLSGSLQAADELLDIVD